MGPPPIEAWIERISQGEGTNLVIRGQDRAARESIVYQALDRAKPRTHVRFYYGELAAAVARDERLSLVQQRDDWSHRISTSARQSDILVIDDLGQGSADASELVGLTNLFDERVLELRPTIASTRFTATEILYLWDADGDEDRTERAHWRLFQNAIEVAV